VVRNLTALPRSVIIASVQLTRESDMSDTPIYDKVKKEVEDAKKKEEKEK
jgi:hypothetical protein